MTSNEHISHETKSCLGDLRIADLRISVCIRHVEEYVEANCNQPILIKSLTKVTGVSARTLFRTFQEALGCSPMAFVKKVRLECARSTLVRPGSSTSVSGVALACGFSNLGHFANDYRCTFGELPSETLKRSRRAVNRFAYRSGQTQRPLSVDVSDH